MKLIAALGLAAALAGPAFLAAARHADEFTPAQKQELGAFIKDYLVNNPDVLREAIEALDKRDKEVAEAEQKKVVADQAGRSVQLEISGDDRQSQGERDPGRILRLQLPLLQRRAARRHQADEGRSEPQAGSQGLSGAGARLGRGGESGERGAQSIAGRQFWPFHYKLLATHGPVGKTEALAVARDLGLDMDKLAKDMDSPEIKTGLDEVMQLADSLQINGTPTFVVGQDVVVGAVGYDQLKDKVDSVHKCGRATC